MAHVGNEGESDTYNYSHKWKLNKIISRPFKNTPAKHASKELQKMVVLRTTHVVMSI
jgi:hypothetical protein